ncbi:MAG: extracellular solute-binding protein [Spirochaetales bacterium]|jgi:maltose-binding protein MalE|nr:extracellular solute-binding protein [Spirochaetales bacterium]
MQKAASRTGSIFLTILLLISIVFLFPSCDALLKMLGILPEDVAPPDAPYGLTAEALSSSQVLVEWLHNNERVSSYDIERKVGIGNFAPRDLISAPANSYLDEDVTPATSYTYRITAIGDGGESEVSEDVTIFTPLANDLPAFDLSALDITRNAGNLGDNSVEWNIHDAPFPVEVKVAKADGTETGWNLFDTAPDNTVLCSADISSFGVGANEVFFRFTFPDTAQSGAVDSLIVHKGPMDLGYPDPSDSQINIPQVELSTGGVVRDAVFEVMLHDPNIAPWVTTARDLILPSDDGSLSVINTDRFLLALVLPSEQYEYVFVEGYNFYGIDMNLELYRNTGASFAGELKKLVGGSELPIADDDGVFSVSLLRYDQDGYRIRATRSLRLNGTNPAYDYTTGSFIFDDIAGGHDYHLYSFWNIMGDEIYWHDHSISEGEAYQLPGVFLYEPEQPVVLVEHMDVQVIDFQNLFSNYRFNNAAAFGGSEYMRFNYQDAATIENILADPAHPLNDNIEMVISRPFGNDADGNEVFTSRIAGGEYRDLSTLGITETDYQPAFQPGGNFYGLPLAVGAHLVLYYNSALMAATPVPATTDELLALDAGNPPAGTAGWLGMLENSRYWYMPWLNGFGGALFDAGGNATLDTPEMVSTLTFAKELVDSGLIPDDPLGAEFLTYDNAQEMFRNGELPMHINGPWAVEYLRSGAVGANLRAAVIPAVSATMQPAQAWYDTFNIYIRDNGDPSTEQAYADMLLTTLTEASIEAVYTFETEIWQAVQLPGLLAAQDLPNVTDQLTLDIMAALPADNPQPYGGVMNDIWPAVGMYFEDVIRGTMTPADAAAAMQADIP